MHKLENVIRNLMHTILWNLEIRTVPRTPTRSSGYEQENFVVFLSQQTKRVKI